MPDFDEDQSLYEHNTSITGGAIKCDGCTMTIDDAIFQFNYANQGGTFLFDNDATATIDTTDITDSNSYGDGGAIAAIKTTLDVIGNTEIKIQNCDNLRDCASEAGAGGFMYLANKYIQVTYENVEVSYMYAQDTTSGQGGVISMTDAD